MKDASFQAMRAFFNNGYSQYAQLQIHIFPNPNADKRPIIITACANDRQIFLEGMYFSIIGLYGQAGRPSIPSGAKHTTSYNRGELPLQYIRSTSQNYSD